MLESPTEGFRSTGLMAMRHLLVHVKLIHSSFPEVGGRDDHTCPVIAPRRRTVSGAWYLSRCQRTPHLSLIRRMPTDHGHSLHGWNLCVLRSKRPAQYDSRSAVVTPVLDRSDEWVLFLGRPVMEGRSLKSAGMDDPGNRGLRTSGTSFEGDSTSVRDSGPVVTRILGT